MQLCDWTPSYSLILNIQAFSGIKRTETQRQKKEARLQGWSLPCTVVPAIHNLFGLLDLIELFGIRQQAGNQQAVN
jgi:hypothetical protein